LEKDILEIKNLRVIYPNNRIALSDVSLSVKDGEFIVIMGKDGAGKSTLGLSIAGLIPRAIKAKLSGTIMISHQEIKSLKRGEMPHYVGMVFQDFETQLFSTNVLLEIAFILENLSLPQSEMKIRIEEVINLLRIDHLRNRSILNLSGGEKQLVAIASVLCSKSKILILDEPTTDLDPLGKEMVYDILYKISGTKIAIDNDSNQALKADRIFIFNDGKAVVRGRPEEILIDNEMLQKNGIRPVDTNLIFPGVLTVEDGINYIRENRINIKPVDFNGEMEKLKEPIIECESLYFGYERNKPVLHNIELKINQGDFLGIIGQNGSGKTTLTKLFCGLLLPQKGRIKIKGRDIRTYQRREIGSLVGYVFQNPDHQIFCNTVKEEVSFALKNFNWDDSRIEQAVKEALEVCDLNGYEDKDPFSLTTGEKQRLAMATVLAFKPPIIILDEPTTGLDYNQQRMIMDVLKSLNQKGYTIIIITHSMWVAAEYTKRAIVMSSGRIVFDLPTRELFTMEEELLKYHLEPPQICRLGNRMGLKILSVEEFKKCLYT